jgi:hypothetical protein
MVFNKQEAYSGGVHSPAGKMNIIKSLTPLARAGKEIDRIYDNFYFVYLALLALNPIRWIRRQAIRQNQSSLTLLFYSRC